MRRILVVGLLCTSSHAIAQACPEQIGTLMGDSVEQAYFFGSQSAIGSDSVLISATRNTTNYQSSHGVFLFDRQSNVEFALLTAPNDASRTFGDAVGLDGSLAIVGSPNSGYGKAYVYDLSSGTAELIYELAPPAPDQSLHFGSSVDLSSTLAAVGSPWEFVTESYAGTVELIDLRTGEFIRKLIPDDSSYYQFFGTGVKIDGTTVLVTNQYRELDLTFFSRSAYLFDAITGTQIAKMLPNDLTISDHFGSAFDLDGSTVVIGAECDDDLGTCAGAVYVFDDAGQLLAKLYSNDPQPYDLFGSSVAIDGTTLLVGARGDDDFGANSGSVYVFDLITMQQIAKIVPPDGELGDKFGSSVAISGFDAVIGASGADTTGVNSGKAYRYNLRFIECMSDFNRDCIVNSADVADFWNAYQLGDQSADINGDTQLNYFDVSQFVQNFNSGCP